MDKNFCFGMLLGLLGGAILATNVPKVQRFIKCKQEKLTEKIKSETNEHKNKTQEN